MGIGVGVACDDDDDDADDDDEEDDAGVTNAALADSLAVTGATARMKEHENKSEPQYMVTLQECGFEKNGMNFDTVSVRSTFQLAG